jgi:hypothetical protein
LVIGRKRNAKEFAVGRPDGGGERNLRGKGLVGEETDDEDGEGEEGQGEQRETKCSL